MGTKSWGLEVWNFADGACSGSWGLEVFKNMRTKNWGLEVWNFAAGACSGSWGLEVVVATTLASKGECGREASPGRGGRPTTRERRRRGHAATNSLAFARKVACY